MRIAVARDGPGFGLAELAAGRGTGDAAMAGPVERVDRDEFPSWVRDRERRCGAELRWVWADTAGVYPELLAAGVRVRRCHDLRLSRAILTGNLHAVFEPPDPADDRFGIAPPGPEPGEPSLFDLADETDPADGGQADLDQVVTEHARQQRALAGSGRPGRLGLLLAAESVGALIAAEMQHDGLPWDVGVHDATLTRLLGERPRFGGRPEKLEELVRTIRSELTAPALNPDSPVELLQALQRHGLDVGSTRQAELERLGHPVVPALIEFKKLSRLASANGWSWSDQWARDGRFRPEYLPGGVVTGRWATRGGGALQLPKQVRNAVRADPGWLLVVADASQLEPRVLAAMAGDSAMAEAARGADLYQALVDRGVVDTRAHAKVAMLGALYGATTGASGQLMPRLTRAYPQAIGLVEDAARAGESYERVSTWLGRCSPDAPEGWRDLRRRLVEGEAGAADARLSRRQTRDWGRFTRNFVVQGTAAEWALSWMGAVRTALAELVGEPSGDPVSPGGGGPHLVYFLHDEVIVHTPKNLAPQVVEGVRAAAERAGRLLFGDTAIEFVLDVRVVESYDQADAPTDSVDESPEQQKLSPRNG